VNGLCLQTGMQLAPRPPVVPTPFNAPEVRPPRPPAPATATMGSAVTGMMMRPPGGFGDRVAAARATPAVAAAAAAERDGIETVTVTNVVSAAPAINKIGSLFTSLNKTVTGALNSIITGAPVAPGGAQTQPMSTALSPLPAWRVPQRPPDAFPDHVQLQRFPPPPPLQHQPVVRTISYESQQRYQQQHVPSSTYWPDFDAQPSYRPSYQHIDQAPPRVPADWYSHPTPAVMADPGVAYGASQATPGELQRLPAAPPAAVIPSTSSAISFSFEPHPSAFSRVDIATSVRDWQSLPDIDRRPGGPGPPSPVYSNASSTCFIPPTDWTSTRFGSSAPIPPPSHVASK